MADLVNDTAKSQLSPRNQEPSHIAGVVSYTDIGGKGVTMPANQVKVDAENGMSQDTSIPKSVGAEGSHLDRINNSVAKSAADQGEGDPELSFDGDEDPITESDDLDKQLDQFESVEPVEIDVTTSKDDDDKDDKKDDDKDGKKKNPFVKEGNDATERGENNSKMQSTFTAQKSEVDKGANKTPLPENADCDDDDMMKEEDGDGGANSLGGGGTADSPKKNASGPAAALNKNVSESLKVHITMPSMDLFESVGVPAKAQRKMSVILESAIKDVAKQISKQTNAHYKKLHESKIAERDAVLTKQMDNYLGYVVEEWVKTNKVAIRTSLRSQMAESLLDGLKTLFTEHYVDVPQSKVDVLKKLTEEVASLKSQMNKATENQMKLRRLAEAANKARIVAQFSRNAKLSEAQIVKLEKLAENTAYTTAKEFREKLSMLRESYFPVEKKELTKLAEEAVVIPEEKKTTNTGDPLVAATLAASKAIADAGKW
jgi:hypothetical protein